MSAEWVSAVAEATTAVFTLALVVAAFWQLPMIASQVRQLAAQIRLTREADENTERRQREWATVAACERYDVDPVLEEVTSRIWDASGGGTNYRDPKVQKRDLVCLLNYMDSLAIGIRQDLYIEGIVKAHMKLVLSKAVREFILSGLVPREGYDNLLRLHEQWNPPEDAAPAYRRGN
jgi:hypothetical protein